MKNKNTKLCTNCSRSYPERLWSCPYCKQPDEQKQKELDELHEYNMIHHPELYSNLTSCTACNKEISNQAETCPHCGQTTGIHICPKCKSSNTKVISGTSKAVSVALFGIFAANKVKSNFQCNKCGHKF